MAFVLWLGTTLILDKGWIRKCSKYLSLLIIISLLDYILSLSYNDDNYFRSALINIVLMYSWSLVFVFYSRHLELVKWPIIWAILATSISAIYTGIGNYIIPEASRELADRSEHKSELITEILNLNIGGYGFIFYIVFLIMPLFLVFRFKVYNRLIILLCLFILLFCILMASYFTGIVISFAMLLLVMLKEKSNGKLVVKVGLLVSFVYLINNPILHLLLDFGEAIDSAAIIRHATEFIEDKGDENVRFELFGNAIRNWLESPIWGMLFTGTKTFHSDHSAFLGFFEMYGLLGIFNILLLRDIYNRTAKLIQSPIIKNYYLLYFLLFIFFLLVDTFPSPIPVSVFFIGPILFLVTDKKEC